MRLVFAIVSLKKFLKFSKGLSKFKRFCNNSLSALKERSQSRNNLDYLHNHIPRHQIRTNGCVSSRINRV